VESVNLADRRRKSRPGIGIKEVLMKTYLRRSLTNVVGLLPRTEGGRAAE
jgi:hypothetical protein